MERKLKSLLHKTRSRSDSDNASPPRTLTHHPIIPSSSDVTDYERENSQRSDRSRSIVIPRKPVAHSSTTSPVNDHQPINLLGSQPAPASQSGRKEVEDGIADDYIAYLPALPQDMPYMSLGGDKRLISNPSSRHHSEDVADRNIEKFSSNRSSSRYSPTNSVEDLVRKLSLGKESTGQRSFGSGGKSPSLQGSFSTGSAHTAKSVIRTPRDEAQMQWRRRTSDEQARDYNAPRASDYGPKTTTDTHDNSPLDKKGNAAVDGATYDPEQQREVLAGVVDLTDTVDVDKVTTWAPAVTHEVVKPIEHEIIEEHIYREIHNHDVYHYIQPVHCVEILPTRHFAPDPSNPQSLIEIAAPTLPDGTTPSPRWQITETAPHPNTPRSRFFDGPRLTKPRIIDDKTYITPEGFERRETTILHPPTLEDMSGYGGAVMPVHFGEEGMVHESAVRKMDERLDFVPEVPPVTLKEMTESLQGRGEDAVIPEAFVPERASSKKYRWSGVDGSEGAVKESENPAVRQEGAIKDSHGAAHPSESGVNGLKSGETGVKESRTQETQPRLPSLLDV